MLGIRGNHPENRKKISYELSIEKAILLDFIYLSQNFFMAVTFCF